MRRTRGVLIDTYSLVPKESNVTLVPHITLIRPNTLSLKGAITLFWVNTKRKTVMTLIRIVLLSNGCAVITLFRIYLKIVMTDPFTFECHYSLLDHVKLKLQSWLSFGVSSFISVLSWLSQYTTQVCYHYSLSAHASLSAPKSNSFHDIFSP